MSDRIQPHPKTDMTGKIGDIIHSQMMSAYRESGISVADYNDICDQAAIVAVHAIKKYFDDNPAIPGFSAS